MLILLRGRFSSMFAPLTLLVLTFVFILQVLAPHALAQQSADSLVESDVSQLMTAEDDLYRLNTETSLRDSIKMEKDVERRLKYILQRFPVTSLRVQVEQDLTSVQELLAKHDLLIAAMYLNRGGHGFKGAQVRLLHIAQEYPNFSQMDDVLFKLAQVYRQLEQTDDAVNCLRKLICNYPASSLSKSAFEKLYEMGVGLETGCSSQSHY